MRYISILGVTGSIGTQTLDCVRNSSEDIKVFGITANSSVEKMKSIIDEFMPRYVGMMSSDGYLEIKKYVEEKKYEIIVLEGMDGLVKIASLKEIDMVVTSVVGMIGLKPTLAAIEAKKDIALANKETLVVAGELVIRKAKENGIKIYPVDSEHSAIYQSLSGYENSDINKIILTASGGPFRGRKTEQLKEVTVEEALKHPKWDMGKKISIDSATLMNKGLEVIEAHFLFDCPYEKIEVCVHPQSIVHSGVEFKDRSIIAQLGSPDMRLPIQYAINRTKRVEEIAKPLSLFEIGALTFENPDMETFKCLKLAFYAGKAGGLMPTVLNSANEILVELFLNRKISFLSISDIIEECMKKFDTYKNEEVTLENILDIDEKVRNYILNKWS